MYTIIKDGAEIGMTEAPTYIKMQENGSFGLCTREEAQGIAFEGKVYHAYGLQLFPDSVAAESVALVESDAGAVQYGLKRLVLGYTDLGSVPTRTINACMHALPEWEPGAYTVGNVRVESGTPYKCVQAHDSTGNPDWKPSATPSLWMQYHGTSEATARPWVAPTGAHDQYMAGECMVWTDGKIYRALSDTVYSPADYSQAWETVSS